MHLSKQEERNLPAFAFNRWPARLLIGAMVLSLFVRWLLVERLPFIMDELYDTNLAVMVARGHRLYADIPLERMPLMTYVIAAFHSRSSSSFDAAIAARRIMWVATTLTLATTWLVARRFLSGLLSLLPPGILMAFSNVLTSSISVRADALSTLLSLPAVLALVAGRLRNWGLFGAGLSLGLAFCTTQKAIYFLIAFSVALAVRVGSEGRSVVRTLGQITRRLYMVALGFAVPLGCLFAYMASRDAVAPFVQQTFFYGATVGVVARTYRFTWIHLIETIERNPGVWGLGLWGAWLLALEGIRNKADDSSGHPVGAVLGVWTLVLFALLLQHTAKFPYVFLTIAPGLALCGGILLGRMGHAAWLPTPPLRLSRLVWVCGVLIVLIGFPAYHHVRAFQSHLLTYQKQVIDRVDQITAPGDAVFDGIGMATTRPQATPWSITSRWYDERAAGKVYPVLRYLQQRQPKVMIETYRLDNLSSSERAFLTDRFVRDWGNVWVVGVPASLIGGDLPIRSANVLTSAEYAVVADDLDRVSIDGTPARAVVRLSSGRHTITVLGPPQTVELRLAVAVRVPYLPARPPAHLFPSYSE